MALAVRSFTPDSNWFTNAVGGKSVTVSWQAGDAVVVFCGIESDNRNINAPTATGLTFANYSLVDGTTGNEAGAGFWAAIAASSGTNVTVSFSSNGAGYGGLAVWVISGGVTGFTAVTGNNTESALSISTASGDAVLYGLTDWNATNPPGKTPLTGSGTATERVDTGNTNNYAIYLADWVGTAAGTFSFGPNNYTNLKVAQVAIIVKAPVTTVIDFAAASTASLTTGATGARTAQLSGASTAGLTASAGGSRIAQLADASTTGLTASATGSRIAQLADASTAGLSASAVGTRIVQVGAASSAGLFSGATGSRTPQLGATSTGGLSASASGSRTVSLARSSTSGLTASASASGTVLFSASSSAGLTSGATGTRTVQVGASSGSGLSSSGTGTRTARLAAGSTASLSSSATAAPTTNLLGTWALSAAGSHNVTIPNATTGKDLYLLVNSAATVTTPSGWSLVTSRVATVGSYIFRLPGENNPGGNVSVTLALSGSRALSVVAFQDDPVDGASTYASLIAPVNTAGFSFGTWLHTFSAKKRVYAIFMFGAGPSNIAATVTTATYDNGFTSFANTGWAGTATSGDEAVSILVGSNSNIGFTNNGVSVTLDAEISRCEAVGFLAFDTVPVTPFTPLASSSSGGLSAGATATRTAQLGSASAGGLSGTATGQRTAQLGAASTSGLVATAVSTAITQLAASSSSGLRVAAAGTRIIELTSSSSSGLASSSSGTRTVQHSSSSSSGLSSSASAAATKQLSAASTSGLTAKATAVPKSNLLGTWSFSSGTSFNITIPNANQGTDVYLLVNSAAVASTPSGWSLVTSRVNEFGSYIFRLPGASNPGGNIAVTVTLSAARALAALSFQDEPVDGASTYASLVAAANFNTAVYGTTGHTFSTKKRVYAIYMFAGSPVWTYTNPITGATFDSGFNLLGVAGWAGTGGSGDEASLIVVGSGSDIGFTNNGVTTTLSGVVDKSVAVGFLAFDTVPVVPVISLASNSSGGLSASATGSRTVRLASTSSASLSASVAVAGTVTLAASSSSALTAAGSGSRTARLAASSSSGLAASATGTRRASLSSSSTSGLTASASAAASDTVVAELATEVAEVATVTPFDTAQTLSAASSAGLSSSASGTRRVSLSGSSTSSLSAAATGSRVISFAASSTASLSASASVSALVSLSATSSASLSSLASGTRTVALGAGTSAGLAAAGTATRRVSLSSTSTAALTASAVGGPVVLLGATSTAGLSSSATGSRQVGLGAASAASLSARATGTRRPELGSSSLSSLTSTASAIRTAQLGATSSAPLRAQATAGSIVLLAYSGASGLAASATGTRSAQLSSSSGSSLRSVAAGVSIVAISSSSFAQLSARATGVSIVRLSTTSTSRLTAIAIMPGWVFLIYDGSTLKGFSALRGPNLEPIQVDIE